MTEQKTVAPPIPISGWVEAGIYVVSIGVLGLIYAIGHQIGAHPIAFILYAMVVSAVMLLAATGLGPDAKRIIMAPQSWLVGAATVGLEIFYYLTLTHITPTTGSLLVRIAIPLAMVIGWVLFSRRPSRFAMAGGLIILVGVCRWLSPCRPGSGPRCSPPSPPRRSPSSCAASHPSSIPGTGVPRR